MLLCVLRMERAKNILLWVEDVSIEILIFNLPLRLTNFSASFKPSICTCCYEIEFIDANLGASVRIFQIIKHCFRFYHEIILKQHQKWASVAIAHPDYLPIYIFTYFFIFWVWYLTHQKFSFKISLSKLFFITELRQRMEFQKETAIVVVSIGWIQRRNEQRRSNNEATKASTHVCNLVL